SNNYVDLGGNFGYFVTNFAGLITGPFPPQLDASGLNLSATSITRGDTATLSGTFRQPGNPDSHTVTINWGDGTASTQLTLAPDVLNFSATHQYQNGNPGTALPAVDTITVTVKNSTGGTASATTSITIKDVPPVTLGPNGEGSPTISGAARVDE